MTAIEKFILPDAGLSTLPTGAVKQVVDALGQSIADGDYLPGETIPMEEELSSKFEVSRTVLREAIKVLSGKGMVRTARRYGSRVLPFEEWHLLGLTCLYRWC
ncbi:MAG: GntR family transcriptional regulator [Pseudomonadota bacterium]